MPTPEPGLRPAESSSELFVTEVTKNWQVMVRVAVRLSDAEFADDVIQNSLLIAWRRWHTFDVHRGTFRAWLLAITADQARKSVKARPRGLRAWPANAPGGEDFPTLRAERRLDVRSAVDSLASRQREAINLYYYADLPVAEVAVILGCSVGTVKSTLSDARKRLKTLMGVEFL